MDGNSPQKESRVGSALTEVPIDAGCITREELAEWLKLVEDEIPKAKISRLTTLRAPKDLPSFSSMTLVIVAMFAASITLAWLAFLVWLALKGISLL